MILGQALAGGGVAVGAVGHRVRHHGVGRFGVGQDEDWGYSAAAIGGLHLYLLVQRAL